MNALNNAAGDEFRDMLATYVERTKSPDWFRYFVKAYPEITAHIDQINKALEKTYGDAVSIGVVYLDDAEPNATKASLGLMLFADGITEIDSWEISEEWVATRVWAGANAQKYVPYRRVGNTRRILNGRKEFLARLNGHVIKHIAEAGLKPSSRDASGASVAES